MKNFLNQIGSKKKLVIWLVLSLIFISVSFVIFNSRQIFFFQYESEYYENLYYHSQWNIPGSTRGISDGSLYKFVGYRLVEGENPFYLNYETPPFGKYLYGLSEYFTGNPYWISLGLYVISLVTLFYLAKLLFKDLNYSLLVLLLFTVTPFIATQVRDTMLDLPLTTFFLLNIFFMVRFFKKPIFRDLIFSGIFLGFATGTKIGIYTPLILLIGFPLVFFARKKFLDLLFYPSAVFLGYIISYTAYFINHKNPIPWIKLHEKQIDFYLSPQEGTIDYLNQWKGIFLNAYQGWWGTGQTSFGDWSPVLPLGVIAAVIVLLLAFKKKQMEWIYIAGTTLSFLIVNTFISFFPRYLMPAVPGFILLIAYLVKKHGIILVILALISLPFFVNSIAAKNNSSTAEAIGSFVAKRAYRELYRSIDPEQRKDIPEEKFINTLENFYESLRVRKIDVKVTDITKTGKNINVRYGVDYLTGYGKISFKPVFEFKDVHNQTVLAWKWDYLWPGYSPDKEIIVASTDQQAQSKGIMEEVYIITRHVQWPDTLNKLAEIVDIPGGVEAGERVNWAIPDDFPRYIGLLKKDLGEEGRKKALEIKGVKIKEINLDGVTDIYFDDNEEREYIIESGTSELENFR